MILSGLPAWELFYIRIRSCNSGGCSESSVLEARTAPEKAVQVPGPTLLIGAGGKTQMFASMPGRPMNSLSELEYTLVYSGNTDEKSFRVRIQFRLCQEDQLTVFLS